jgi:hypothetical protein
LKETEAGGVIFIVIGKALSLAGGDGINWGKRWSSIGVSSVRGGRWRSGGVVAGIGGVIIVGGGARIIAGGRRMARVVVGMRVKSLEGTSGEELGTAVEANAVRGAAGFFEWAEYKGGPRAWKMARSLRKGSGLVS